MYLFDNMLPKKLMKSLNSESRPTLFLVDCVFAVKKTFYISQKCIKPHQHLRTVQTHENKISYSREDQFSIVPTFFLVYLLAAYRLLREKSSIYLINKLVHTCLAQNTMENIVDIFVYIEYCVNGVISVVQNN